MKKTINWSLAVIFLIFMLFLTFFARDIHNSRIPNVTAKRLTLERFVASGNNIHTVQYRKLAIPKELYNSGTAFVISERVINGEKRTVVKQVFIEIGAENEDFYEVVGGIYGHEAIVVNSNQLLSDGVEVIVVPE